ncbi:adenylate cyclase, partial [Achromobacter insolitus]
MNTYSRILRPHPWVAAVMLAACAGAAAQTYAPPPAPAAPVYDDGDPASANLALVERSPQPPPPLPVYVQPPAPADGYMWVPGYWGLNRYGFFWVPGAWVLAPYPGALWTPGYWGFNNGIYLWNPGYWGPHVGFYGGINYGFGYNGLGYVGGYWKRDRFYYNRSVTNVNVTRVTNVYNHTVVVNKVDNRRVSYHGGPSGIRRDADPRELAARKERHSPQTDVQRGYVRDAGNNRAQFYDHNKGRPPQAFVDHGRPAEGQRPGDGRDGRDGRDSPRGNGRDNRGGEQNNFERGDAQRGRDTPPGQQGRPPQAQGQQARDQQRDPQAQQQARQ